MKGKSFNWRNRSGGYIGCKYPCKTHACIPKQCPPIAEHFQPSECSLKAKRSKYTRWSLEDVGGAVAHLALQCDPALHRLSYSCSFKKPVLNLITILYIPFRKLFLQVLFVIAICHLWKIVRDVSHLYCTVYCDQPAICAQRASGSRDALLLLFQEVTSLDIVRKFSYELGELRNERQVCCHDWSVSIDLQIPPFSSHFLDHFWSFP